MAKKPFEIQSAKLRIGGVDLEAGNTTIVIPGVTQATTYQVEEVEDTDVDQTYNTYTNITVIDAALYNAIVEGGDTSHFADYITELDDDGYIDEIEVGGSGTYSSGESTAAASNDMYAYIGTGSGSDRPLVPEDWIQIPFRPKMRVKDVENINGGNGDIGDVSVTVDEEFTRLTIENKDFEISTTRTEDQDADIVLEAADDIFITANGDELQLQAKNDVTIYSGDSAYNWSFNASGELVFPDGSIQTTAYTGQEFFGPLYVMANVDGRIATSSNGTEWSTAFNTGLPSIGTVAVGPDRIVYSGVDINNDAGGEGGSFSGLYSSQNPRLQPTLITGTDIVEGSNLYFNQVQYFAGTTYPWIAVGYIQGVTYKNPLIAYSTDGVSWSFTTFNDATEVYTSLDLEFMDITHSDGVYLIAARGGPVTGGLWTTTDITAILTIDNRLSIDEDFKAVEYFGAGGYHRWTAFSTSVDWYGTNNADPSIVEDWEQMFDTDAMATIIQQETGLQGQSVEEATAGMLDDGTWVWMTSSSNGHIVWWPNAPVGPFVSVPMPYTTSVANITSNTVASISFGGNSPDHNEKIVITDVTPSDFNGTYYYNNNDNGLYTDINLTTPFDSSALTYITGGTVTRSRGTYIDSLGYAAGKFYCANDDEQIFEGVITVGEGISLAWTKVDDKDNSLAYWNDFAYYSNFTSTGGGTSDTGDVTFSGNKIIGTGTNDGADGLNLSPGPGLDASMYFRIHGGDNPTHLHLSVGDTEVYDQYFGSDWKYLKLGLDGVISIGTSNSTWKFDTDGQTTFPTLTVPISDNATPSGTGQTIKFSDSTQQAIIYGPASTVDNINAERVIIQGAPGYTDTTGEGGDVYLWAGPGGSAGGDGGDIKIRAGRGIAAGNGGYLNFQAGNSVDGNGGYINIESGSSSNGTGGNITIDANSGGQLALYTAASGNITLNTAGGGNVWTFDSTGKTTLPGAVVKSTVAKTYTDPTIYDMFFEVVAVDVNGVVTGINVTNSPNANWFYGTGTIILNDVNISIAVDGGGNASVTINDGGSGGHFIGETASLPGAAFGAPTITNPIDLTKSINKLVEGQYTLADGVEGQIIYLKMQPNQDPNNIFVEVTNSNLGQNYVLIPFIKFDPDTLSNVQTFSFCTLIFADGEWTQFGGMWDS